MSVESEDRDSHVDEEDQPAAAHKFACTSKATDISAVARRVDADEVGSDGDEDAPRHINCCSTSLPHSAKLNRSANNLSKVHRAPTSTTADARAPLSDGGTSSEEEEGRKRERFFTTPEVLSSPHRRRSQQKQQIIADLYAASGTTNHRYNELSDCQSPERHLTAAGEKEKKVVDRALLSEGIRTTEEVAFAGELLDSGSRSRNRVIVAVNEKKQRGSSGRKSNHHHHSSKRKSAEQVKKHKRHHHHNQDRSTAEKSSASQRKKRASTKSPNKCAVTESEFFDKLPTEFPLSPLSAMSDCVVVHSNGGATSRTDSSGVAFAAGGSAGVFATPPPVVGRSRHRKKSGAAQSSSEINNNSAAAKVATNENSSADSGSFRSGERRNKSVSGGSKETTTTTTTGGEDSNGRCVILIDPLPQVDLGFRKSKRKMASERAQQRKNKKEHGAALPAKEPHYHHHHHQENSSRRKQKHRSHHHHRSNEVNDKSTTTTNNYTTTKEEAPSRPRRYHHVSRADKKATGGTSAEAATDKAGKDLVSNLPEQSDMIKRSLRHHHHREKKLTSSDEGLPRSPPKTQVEATTTDEIKTRRTRETVAAEKSSGKASSNNKSGSNGTKSSSRNHNAMLKQSSQYPKKHRDVDRYHTGSKVNGATTGSGEKRDKRSGGHRAHAKTYHMHEIATELALVGGQQTNGKSQIEEYPLARPVKPGYERWLRIDNGSSGSSDPSTSSSCTSSATSGSSYLSYTCKTNSDGSDSSYVSQTKSSSNHRRHDRRIRHLKNNVSNSENDSHSDEKVADVVNRHNGNRKSTSNIVHQRHVSTEEQKRSSRFHYEADHKKTSTKRAAGAGGGGQYSPAELQQRPHLGTRRERPSRMSAKAEDEECHSKWQHHHLVVVSQKPGDLAKNVVKPPPTTTTATNNYGNSITTNITKPEYKSATAAASNKTSLATSASKKSVTIRDLYSLHNVLSDTQNGTVIAGYRRSDGLRVAIKRISKSGTSRWGWLGGKVVPLELTLLCQVNEVRGNGVVEILEWHETNEAFLLVMVRPHPAVDLYDYVSKHRRLRETLARHIGRQLMIALQHCKTRGVLHRDVKLENMLFNPETHEVTLIDFGCGDYVRTTPYKEFAGTPEYYPPEWFSRKQYDGDMMTIWSVGILLYSVICGCLPFRSPKDIMDKEITKFPSDVSNSARDLLLKMLKKSPRERLPFGSVLSHSWFLSQP